MLYKGSVPSPSGAQKWNQKNKKKLMGYCTLFKCLHYSGFHISWLVWSVFTYRQGLNECFSHPCQYYSKIQFDSLCHQGNSYANNQPFTTEFIISGIWKIGDWVIKWFVFFVEVRLGSRWWTLLFFYFFFFYFLIILNILKFWHELPELHITSAYHPKRLLKGISNWILP